MHAQQSNSEWEGGGGSNRKKMPKNYDKLLVRTENIVFRRFSSSPTYMKREPKMRQMSNFKKFSEINSLYD